jgi:SAM-dependent methyltransferase
LRDLARRVRQAPVTNICASPYGACYSFFIERPWLARPGIRLILGVTLVPYYRGMESLSRVDAHATVLDVPCGAGVALRALGETLPGRYVAVDISETMLARFERRAAKRMLPVETIQADMRALPLQSGIVDLCLSFSGLHMVVDPEAALAEMIRCLKPGGTLTGATFVAEGGRRQRVSLRYAGRGGACGLPPAVADLRRWLHDLGIADPIVSPERGLVIFGGRKRLDPNSSDLADGLA